MTCIINETNEPVRRNPLSNLNSNTPIQDTTSRLKTELHRCLTDQRQRRIELKLLQEQLDAKDVDIKNLREDENKLLVDLEKQKAEASRYAKRLKLLQNDLTRLFRLHERSETGDSDYTEKLIDEIERDYGESRQRYEDIQQHQEQLIKELSELRSDRNSLENRLLELSAAKDADQELVDQSPVMSAHLKQLQEECEKLRQMYMEMSAAKTTVINELAELKRSDSKEKWPELVNRMRGLEDRITEGEQKRADLCVILERERNEFKQHLREKDAELCAGKINKIVNIICYL